MASIQKKGNKYYIVTKVDGKQKWIAGKKTKAETKKYMFEILHKIDSDKIRIDTVNITVKQYLDNWFNTYCLANLKLTTYSGYRKHIDQYIVPRIGNLKLVNLRPIDVQAMYYDVLKNGRLSSDKPLNSKTVIQTHRILRKALKSAVMLQIIESNPCDCVELPRKKPYKHDILQEDEIKDYINHFKGTVIYLPVLLAVSLGLRRGEILGLLWSDIDFKEKTVDINKTLVYSDRQLKVDTTKNLSSNRVLLMSAALLKLLEEIKEERSASDDHYVVLNLKGIRYNPASFSRMYCSIRSRLKLKKIRFHDLRHSNATLMHKSGIKTKVMQERLGHSNISTTLDIYTHLFKEDQEKVASIIDEKIF